MRDEIKKWWVETPTPQSMAALSREVCAARDEEDFEELLAQTLVQAFRMGFEAGRKSREREQ